MMASASRRTLILTLLFLTSIALCDLSDSIESEGDAADGASRPGKADINYYCVRRNETDREEERAFWSPIRKRKGRTSREAGTLSCVLAESLNRGGEGGEGRVSVVQSTFATIKLKFGNFECKTVRIRSMLRYTLEIDYQQH